VGIRSSVWIFDDEVIEKLSAGTSPLFEPELEALVKTGLEQNKLRFTTDPADALRDAEIVWCAYDTPVDDDDNAQVEWVVERVQRVFPYLAHGALLLISSQLPVGTTRRLETLYRDIS
jgi:Predicted UDP-glucose 6-dehydrogenase